MSHLPVDQLPPKAHQLGVLTEYSLIRRYEKGFEVLAPDDIQLAIELAEAVLAWSMNLCSEGN